MRFAARRFPARRPAAPRRVPAAVPAGASCGSFSSASGCSSSSCRAVKPQDQRALPLPGRQLRDRPHRTVPRWRRPGWIRGETRRYLQLAAAQPQHRPMPMAAPIAASGPVLTSRERRRLEDPFVWQPESARYNSSAITMPSTASPRNSRRSLLSSVGAAMSQRRAAQVEPRGSRPSSPRSQRGQRLVPCAIIDLRRCYWSTHALSKCTSSEMLPNSGSSVLVVGNDHPVVAFARRPAHRLTSGYFDALDVEALFQLALCTAAGLTWFPRRRLASATCFTALATFNWVQVDGRQPDAGVTRRWPLA